MIYPSFHWMVKHIEMIGLNQPPGPLWGLHQKGNCHVWNLNQPFYTMLGVQ